MRALRLAPVLLALAACSVDTDSLKPKSAADCEAIGQKVCGNRCMPPTVENGCGQAGCNPCAAAPQGSEVFCDGSAPSQCAVRAICRSGTAYCEGPYDTTCEDLATSTLNCGRCGRVCDTTCADFRCAPTLSLPVGTSPLDIGSDGSSLFWFTNPAASIALFRSDRPATPVATWPGHATRLEVDATGAVLWSDRPGAPGDPIWEVPAGAAAATLLFTPNSAVRALALDPGFAYFSEVGSSAANESAVDLLEVNRAANATPGRFAHHAFTGDRGLTAVALEQPSSANSRAVVGTETGALRWLSYDLATNGTYATAVEAPKALVTFNGQFGSVATPRTILFWIGDSGNLYAKILPDSPVVNLTGWSTPSSTGAVDIYADDDGVYWSDSGFQASNVGFSGTYGMVAEWRASFDDVVILALSPTSRPTRVTATRTHVQWLESSNGAVYAVAK